MRRNEQCWQTLDHDDTFELIVGFKKFTVNSNSKHKITNNKFTILLISIFSPHEKTAPPYTFRHLAPKLS